MIIKIFSVRDIKSGAFMQPFFARAKGEAMRMIADSAEDKNTLLGKHPQDFELYWLGDFDDQTGVVTSVVESLSDVESLVVKPG